MEYRIDKQGLLDRISAWDGFLKRKVHLIACGGTAMTLLGVKASTKDIDLLVPNEDCLALLKAKKGEIDLIKLEKQFREAASYDVSKEVVIKNWDHFLRLVKKEMV